MANGGSGGGRHRFPYAWKLKDGFHAAGITPAVFSVFNCFCCGGGSSMGYELAGYHHLGGVEIDPKVAKAYVRNLNPPYVYTEDIRDFNQQAEARTLPDELYHLDVLEGSPPCTTFSLSGNREADWGRARKFHEGGTEQTLDDLVYIYCETAAILRPKVVVLENVEGILLGDAVTYARGIKDRLEASGYDVQIFRLKAERMGVPQRRHRAFFIGRRRDLKLAPIKLSFTEPPIPFGEVVDRKDATENLSPAILEQWKHRTGRDHKMSDTTKRTLGIERFYNWHYAKEHEVMCTLTTGNETALFDRPRTLNRRELERIGSWPSDYDYCGIKPDYLIGMSVPPVMAANIAFEIRTQWLEG